MKRLMSIVLAGALLVGGAAFAEPALAGKKSKSAKASIKSSKKQKNRQANKAANHQKARTGDASANASGTAGAGTGGRGGDSGKVVCFSIDSGDNHIANNGANVVVNENDGLGDNEGIACFSGNGGLGGLGLGGNLTGGIATSGPADNVGTAVATGAPQGNGAADSGNATAPVL